MTLSSSTNIDLSSVFNHLRKWGTFDARTNAIYKYDVGSEQAEVCLVSFGYSMKDSADERKTALDAAVKSRGILAVVDRLEFLLQAWSGTQSFVHVVETDLEFVRALTETPEYNFEGPCI